MAPDNLSKSSSPPHLQLNICLQLATMLPLNRFFLLAIAVLVAARSPAIERQYAVSGPGEEETPLFASAVSANQKVKRSLAAAVEPPPQRRQAPRYSKARKESEFFSI